MPDAKPRAHAQPLNTSEDTSALDQRTRELENEVTVLRQALALRQSNAESTYRAVFNAVNDAICILHVETGIIVDINHAVEQRFGYKREEVLDQMITLLSGPAEQPLGSSNLYWQGVLVGQEQQFEWLCRTKGGLSFFGEIVMKRVRLSGRDRIVVIIRDIGERKERERLQEELIQIQAATLLELSSPLIPISDRAVVMPLIGSIDERRAKQVLETILIGVASTGVEVAILDITGVRIVDTQVANALLQVAQAVRLLGSRLILTGIRPEVAQILIDIGADLREISTYGTLQAGIASILGARAVG